ncbi:hypothetical protein G4B88_028009 [Cannabis sativa]|uniref:Uncharacterized protein n=1 Tax=Cannabis sativa TaxID=3483 RepID=A0A7J6I880_CANSA|nr:hypothetical protein G4B88_028009 [Cannabis sativa]
MEMALELKRIESDGSFAANCLGISPMPLAGIVLSPRARLLKMKSNNLEVVSRSRSKKIPPKNGRKNLPIMDSENPMLLRSSIVDTSFAVIISSSDFVRTPSLVDAMRNLSRIEPIGFVRDWRESTKCRMGSATMWNSPL